MNPSRIRALASRLWPWDGFRHRRPPVVLGTEATVGPAELPGFPETVQAALAENRQALVGGALGQAVTQGVGGGVGAAAGPDLAVQVGHVPLDGMGAQPEPTGDLRVGLARGQQAEHL